MFLSHEEYQNERKDNSANDNLSNPRESVDLIKDPSTSHEEKGRSEENKVEDAQSFEDTREEAMDPAFDTRKPLPKYIFGMTGDSFTNTIQEAPQIKRLLFCDSTLFFHIFVSTLTV